MIYSYPLLKGEGAGLSKPVNFDGTASSTFTNPEGGGAVLPPFVNSAACAADSPARVFPIEHPDTSPPGQGSAGERNLMRNSVARALEFTPKNSLLKALRYLSRVETEFETKGARFPHLPGPVTSLVSAQKNLGALGRRPTPLESCLCCFKCTG